MIIFSANDCRHRGLWRSDQQRRFFQSRRGLHRRSVWSLSAGRTENQTSSGLVPRQPYPRMSVLCVPHGPRPQIHWFGLHEETRHQSQHNSYHRQGRHYLQDWAAEVQGMTVGALRNRVSPAVNWRSNNNNLGFEKLNLGFVPYFQENSWLLRPNKT